MSNHYVAHFIKKKQQAPNRVTALRPYVSKINLIPKLIAVTASLRKLTFNQSIWNYLVSTFQIVHPIGPFFFPLGG